MASRPRTTTAWYRGIPYVLDLVRCRQALVDQQIEGRIDSMESLGNACSISRSTASRFFAGRQTSLAVTVAILKALGLTFDEVASPAAADDDGTAGVAIPAQPAPDGRLEGAAATVRRLTA
jgi:hypothetical protein